MNEERFKRLRPVERLASRATVWLGSVPSLITHTILFAASLALWFFGIDLERILLALTTVVSLEAIYLSLFIQMSVNRNTESLEEVEADVEDIKEDVDKVEAVVGEIDTDLDAVQKSIQEIDSDIDTVQAGIRDLDTDIEEMSEDDDKHEASDMVTQRTLGQLQETLALLSKEIESLKKS